MVPSTIQSHLTYTFSPRIHILTSCTYSDLTCPLHHSKSPRAHLEYTFSPCVHILTSCTYSHLVWPPPSFKVTSHTHSHLMYTFSPHVHILTSRAPSTTQSHLVPISSTHSHLAYTFSPRVHILTLCGPLHHSKSPRIHILTSLTHSHLAYIFSPRVLPSTQNNIFHLAWKNSQKSHAAIPIASIRYLLRATKYYFMKGLVVNLGFLALGNLIIFPIHCQRKRCLLKT